MFRLWTTDELKDAIKSLEQQLADGTWSVSYSGGGFTQNISPNDARVVLQDMYAELGTRDGYKHLARRSARTIYIRMKDC